MTSIRVGQMEILGTIDHSTPIDAAGGWIWRGLRSVVTGDLIHSVAEIL